MPGRNKALYEIGELEPKLISEYVNGAFSKTLLVSKKAHNTNSVLQGFNLTIINNLY